MSSLTITVVTLMIIAAIFLVIAAGFFDAKNYEIGESGLPGGTATVQEAFSAGYGIELDESTAADVYEDAKQTYDGKTEDRFGFWPLHLFRKVSVTDEKGEHATDLIVMWEKADTGQNESVPAANGDYEVETFTMKVAVYELDGIDIKKLQPKVESFVALEGDQLESKSE